MKKKLLVLTACFMMLLTSGCGSSKYITIDGEIIKNGTTGQQLRKDILCRPSSDHELYDIYKEYEEELDFSLDELPKCEDFKINSNESSSLWEFIFVKPTAWAIVEVGRFVVNLGIAVIIVGILIRLLLLPLQIKTNIQSRNMKKAAPEMQRIEKKYKDKTDQASMMAKSQELMMVYQKYKVNPFAGCLPAFVQLPIFFAFLSAIYRIPAIYEQELLGWNLGTTPLVGMQNGEYQYLVLLILIAVSTYFSFKLTMKENPTINEEQAKQSKMMMNIMLIMIISSSLMFPAALHFYWIATYVFIAIQTKLVNKYLESIDEDNSVNRISQKDSKSPKNIKEKLDKKEGKKNEQNSKKK